MHAKTDPGLIARPVPHRISVEEYDRMVEADVFDEDARLELINGEIVEMTPIGPPHSSRVDRLNMFFASRLAGRAIVRVQGPVRMGRYSEPQPDVLLLKPRDDYYSKRHPGAEDVLLVVEVAQSSLAIDRDVKGPLYRGERVLEYWIVNLIDEVIEVHRSSEPRIVRTARRGESLSPVAFPDLVIAVEDILGAAV
jgi:Uma2 family endonuclease